MKMFLAFMLFAAQVSFAGNNSVKTKEAPRTPTAVSGETFCNFQRHAYNQPEEISKYLNQNCNTAVPYSISRDKEIFFICCAAK